MYIDDKIYILIHKDFTEEISVQEQFELNSWIDESEVNKSEYLKLKKQLADVKVPKPSSNFDLNLEWNKLNERIQTETTTFNFFSGVKYYGIAASIIIVLALSFLMTSLDESGTIVRNESDSKKRVQLPDNSLVILDKNSEIKYNFDENQRMIDLEGKAFFDVEKSNVSFIVNTQNSRIRVLGTEFSVETSVDYSSVAVRSGRVEFSNKKQENVILVVNQFSECYEDALPSEPDLINIDSLLTWMETRLVFENKSLNDVLKKLKDEYNVVYNVENQELLDKKLTAIFDNEKLDVIHKSISTALKISITKKGDGYYIKK